MPRQLALVLCTAFVLFLLRLERQQFREVSFTLWIPTFYVLMISSKPLAVWFGTGGVDMESGSALDRVALSLILCLGLVVLVKRQFNWVHALQENPWITLLIGYMFISILWSGIPFTSFKQWIRELVALTMAFLISTEEKPFHALNSLFTRTIYILIPYSLMLIDYYPHLGREYARWSGSLMWIGVSTQKNGLCRLCFFALFFFVWTFIRRWQGRDRTVRRYQPYVEMFLFLLTIWLFMGPDHTLAYSATSTVALCVGLTSLLGLVWLKKRARSLHAGILLVPVVSIIIYGTITPFVGKLTIIDVSSTFGRNETLTDRTSIWAFLVPLAMRSPILGHGFGGFWNEAIRGQTSSHAHNGYLDTILNLGFVGLFLFAMFLLISCQKAHKAMVHDFDWSALWICLLLMATIHNIAESTITSFASPLVAFLLFLAVCFKSRDDQTHLLIA